ncbi:double zinc ribbon and ankyrin repeat-containing protein 1 isoform X2 [Patella vulgata]|uniref:double zinc ribbon and ankyrin repeat-containing protein 1 isoform X2 n=1 Tax=Patella vulgata TaxID=6465 RepID=UPI0024A91325|nr:double zinc ribbon and ankyrin repeat-containing protein 1 isoform X2 [Patella vulgata]
MTAGSIIVPTIIPLRPPVPGRSKLAIDSNTRIEISSDSLHTTIYYTINGSKPEPFQRIGGQKTTIQYRCPFTLPAGRHTVKAVAVSEDGMRESNVVTKTFDVDFVEPPPRPPEDDDLGFQYDLDLERSKIEVKRAASKIMTSPKSAWTDVNSLKHSQQRKSDMRVTGSSHRRPQSGTRFLNSRMGYGTDRSHRTEPLDGLDLARSDSRHGRRRAPPDNTTQALRLQRETDFLKCIYCFADRPSDPFCRYCTTCGNTLPDIPKRLTPTEPGQMGTCVYCKSTVPMNTSACIICEGPIKVQNQPQSSVRLADKLICTLCGTANPSSLVACVTCNTRLPTSAQQSAILNGKSAPPPVSSPDSQYLRCNKCSRVNSGDARYCDWCGCKPSASPGMLQCSTCGSSNNPYSSFCGGCGTTIEAPGRTVYKMDGTGKSLFLPVSQSMTQAPRPVVHATTQTVGLFYPSRGPNKPEVDDRASFEKQMRDRKPLLTPVSPGRGYWRKQLDHICQHLKIYTQNNPEFRSLIGEPKMGKLISSTVQEDGYEMSLTLTFPLRGGSDKQTGKKLGVSHQGYLSQHTEHDGIDSYRSDSDDYESDENVTPKTNKKKGSKKSKPKKKLGPKLSALDQQLVKELGSEGEGAATEVQHLLDEGADVNCVNKNGVPVIYSAVRNKHLDCIPVLVDGGLDINKKGPSALKGNTALHEAVNLGPSGLKVIDVLLENGADQNRKNDRGETPLDLAKKAGYDSVITKFAAALGQSQLAKMTKPRH